MLIYAYEFSEKFQIPTMLRPTTRVSHAKSDIDVEDIKPGDRHIEFKKDQDRFVVLPKNTRVLLKKLNAKQDDMRKALASSPWNHLRLEKGAKLGIIASGVASIYAEEAMETLGTKVSYLKIGAYPIDPSLIQQLANSVEQVLVLEELMPVVEEQVRMYATHVSAR